MTDGQHDGGRRRRASWDRDDARGRDDRRDRRKPTEAEYEDEKPRERRAHRRSRSPDSGRRPRSREREDDRYRERNRRRKRTRDEQDPQRRRRRYDGSESEEEKEEEAADQQRMARSSPLKRSAPLPSQGDSFAVSKGDEPEKPKEKPNYGSSGALAAASNAVAQADGSTVTLKYHEPPEARKPPPRDQWKLFVFKGKDIVDTVDLSARSCWLVGREMAVVDLAAEHPSISKQHAVVQFRHTEKTNEYGDRIGKVKPYLIDLESANGTKLNGDKVPDSRYLELRDKDMLQFGHSTREYVIMLAPRN